MRLWLNDKQAMNALLLWVAVANQVLHVHFDLFSSGKLHARMREGGRSAWTYGLRKTSLPWRVLNALTTCMSEAYPDHAVVLALPIAFIGNLRSWAENMLATLASILQLTAGNLWRRFCVRLSSYPFLLMPLVQPDVVEEEKVHLAQQAWETRACCIDELFTEKFRSTLTGPDDLVHNRHVTAFLASSLQQMMPTTTHIENGFAHMRKTVTMGWRAPSMHSLASHHVLGEHKRVHELWLRKKRAPGRFAAATPDGSKPNKRPIWVWSKKRRQQHKVSGYNEFVAEMFSSCRALPGDQGRNTALRTLAQAWRDLTPAARQRLVQHLLSPFLSWGSGQDDAWPLHVYGMAARECSCGSYLQRLQSTKS